MKKSLLDYIQYYTKLDERTIKYYLDLLDQRILSNEFFNYYTKEYSLLNFERWLIDKSLLIKIQDGYLILPPISALLAGLVKLRDNLKSINDFYIRVFLESIRDFEKEILMLSDINADEEINVIATYRDLLNATIKSLIEVIKNIEDVLNYYGKLSEQVSSLLENLSNVKIKLDKDIADLREKIESLNKFIEDGNKKISSEIMVLEESLREVKNEVTNFVDEFKNTAENSTNNITELIKTQVDLIEKTVNDLLNSIRLMKDKEKELEKDLIEILQAINEKKKEIEMILNETERNINEIIRGEADNALKTIKDTLNLMSEETLKIFDKNLQDINNKVIAKSNDFSSKIDSVSKELGKKASELISIQEKVISNLRESLDRFLKVKTSDLDCIEDEILNKMNKLIEVNESLIKRINERFAMLNEIADKQAHSLSRYISIHLTNLEVEKEHLMEHLKAIFESRNDDIKTLDAIFSRLKGAIGRLEDLYNLKIRQIYKSLNDLKKEGEQKLQKISVKKVLGSIETLMQNVSNALTSITQSVNLIERLGNKIDLRFTKFIEKPPEIDKKRLNELIGDLNEDDRKELIKLFNQQRNLYLSTLETVQRETKKDINSVLGEVKQKIEALNEFDNKIKADIDNFVDELKKSVLDAYNDLINEYINLLYEGTKESIIQMIYDGERVIEEERLKMDKEFSSSTNLNKEIISYLGNLFNAYHERIANALNDLQDELKNFTVREFTEFKESIIKGISNSIELYKNDINELSEKLKTLTKPLKNYLEKISLELRVELDKEANEIKNTIEDYLKSIGDFSRQTSEEINILSKEIVSEISNILEQVKELKKIDIENHIRIFNKTMDSISKSISNSINNTINAASSLINTSLDDASEGVKRSYSELLEETVKRIDKGINDAVLTLKNKLDEANRIADELNETKIKCLSKVDNLATKLGKVNTNIDNVSKNVINTNNELSMITQETVDKMNSMLASYQEVLEESVKLIKDISTSESGINTLIKDTNNKIKNLNKNVDELKADESLVINIFDQYIDALTKPVDYLKKTVNLFKKNYSKKLKRKETSVSTEIINLIDLSNALLSVMSNKWRDRKIIGEIIYGKDIVIEYIKSAVKPENNDMIMLIPSEVMNDILDIAKINEISGRLTIYTSKTDLDKRIIINRNMKIERIKEDIPYLVIISKGNRAIICNKDLNYAIEFVDEVMINEMLLTWIKSKYVKKLKFRI